VSDAPDQQEHAPRPPQVTPLHHEPPPQGAPSPQHAHSATAQDAPDQPEHAARPDALPREIAEALAQRRDVLGDFARTPVYFACTSSTNDRAAELAVAGAHEGTWVIADEQTSGRGRRGRAWASPPGAGLYLSVVFRPQPGQHVDATSLLTLMAGVAAVSGVRAASGLTPTLKWPNDLVIEPFRDRDAGSAGVERGIDRAAGAAAGGIGSGIGVSGTGVGGGSTSRFRKLAGILAEASATGGELQFIILGIGINLTPAAYPPDVAARATSIEGELGRPADRALVLVETLAALARGRRQLLDGDTAGVLNAWRALAPSSVGRRVRWQPAGVARSGATHGIDDTGALLVRTSTGVERIIAGEVEWE
jgi:BirA family biotin operon repressor/biotin-[acetyl-CoA-carboxylase] ligase